MGQIVSLTMATPKITILVIGPPGIEKEAFEYWSKARRGPSQGDLCLYVTRLAVFEVLQDTRAFEGGKMEIGTYVS